MHAEHGSEFASGNISLVDCLERLSQLLANFLVRLTDDKLFYFTHVTHKLRNTCVGFAACVGPFYRYNCAVFQ